MKEFKKILFLAFVFALSCVEVLAQTHKVVGVVKDVKGEPLIGVTIIPIGATQSGTVTDFDGNYIVNVPKGIKQLKLTYMGYVAQTINIKGRSKIDVVMKEDNQMLDQVVVTAMGIKRKSKTLTYATQSVSGKDLTRIKEPNFVNALRGKSAGLQITPNNSGAGGGSTKIVLRGQNSIMGSNQPLIVLDGVPLSGGDEGGANVNLYEGASRDNGDILSTINPDDISSITVLKGPSAAALYGSSANNGVLMITTKSGREGKIRVNVSSSTMADVIALYPKLQERYALSTTSFQAWGKKMSELTADELASEPYYTCKPRNTIKDFFDVGLTQNTSVTISGGTAKQQAYFSYANTYQTGIMPGNKFMRHNVMFKHSYKLYDKLNFSLSLNYIHQNTKDRPVAGRTLSPLYAVYRTPANVDMRYFKYHYQHLGTDNDPIVTNKSKESGNPQLKGRNIQTWFWTDENLNNPYWLLNKISDEAIQDRMLASFTLKYDILKDLNFQSRTNLDYRLSEGKQTRYASYNLVSPVVGGHYYSGKNKSVDFFQDALLSYNKTFIDKLALTAVVGGSYSRSNWSGTSITNNQSSDALPGVLLPGNNLKRDDYNQNGSTLGASDRWGNNWSSAIFSTATLGWDDKVFLDGSYRVDWAKSFQQFAEDNEYISFSYYSIGANTLLDKVFKFGEDVNSMKLRASYSVVGNPIPNRVYSEQTYNSYNPVSISAPQPKFDNPQPETTTSFEVGLDGAFFNNRLDFDLTYYVSELKNQFLIVNGTPKNTGKIRNWGVEFATNYRFNLTKDLTWKTGFNIAYNENKLLETYVIPETGEDYVYYVGPNKFRIKYVKGGSFGDIYVNSFQRDEKGHIKLNAQGAPLFKDDGFRTMVGNATAPINYGFNNTFTYKNFQLYFLLDGKIGGKVMSLTQADLDRYGLSEASADARDRGFVELPDGSGRQVDPTLYYKAIGDNPSELYVYDATNLRLREMSLAYTFYDLLGPSKNLSLSLLARNLFFIYKDSPVDPDISQSTANGFGGIDAYAMPTTRTFGLSAKLTF